MHVKHLNPARHQLGPSGRATSAAPTSRLRHDALWPCAPLAAPQGFQRVADNLGDTVLDNPGARERFDEALQAARAGGWVDDSFNGQPTTPSGCPWECPWVAVCRCARPRLAVAPSRGRLPCSAAQKCLTAS